MANSVRHALSFQETMKKYFGGIDSLIYAAEIACPVEDRDNVCFITQLPNLEQCDGCPFQYVFEDVLKEDNDLFECKLLYLRRWCGDHFEQHDIPGVELSTTLKNSTD